MKLRKCEADYRCVEKINLNFMNVSIEEFDGDDANVDRSRSICMYLPNPRFQADADIIYIDSEADLIELIGALNKLKRKMKIPDSYVPMCGGCCEKDKNKQRRNSEIADHRLSKHTD